MNELQIKAVIAGLLFGLWPLFMNKSGLIGNHASMAFTLAVLCIISPLAIYSGTATLATANWRMVAFAGLFGALGLLVFNSVLAQAKETVGLLFVLMLVAQIVVPAAYDVYLNGSTLTKLAGFTLAALAAFLLS